MSLQRVPEEMRAYRENLDAAIAALQRLAVGGKRKRGRPPKWMAAAKKAEND